MSDLKTRVAELAERLERRGIWVSEDYRVRESGAAFVLGVTARTLQRWREAGMAPPFITFGRLDRILTYDLHDVLKWIDSRRHAA